MNRNIAREMRRFVADSNLPMVNAEARTDINLLALSGATHGIFVDKRHQASALRADLLNCLDVVDVKMGFEEPHPSGRPIERFGITFTHDGKQYRVDYFHADALNMDSILGGQKISLYYSAVQFGPDRIANSAFDNLVKDGYMFTPYHLGADDVCFGLTGLKLIDALNFNATRHIREPFDSYLYQKVKCVPPVGSTTPSPGLLAFCYLTGMM